MSKKNNCLLLVVLLINNVFAQKNVELYLGGSTAFLTNSTKYKNNFSNNLILSIPIVHNISVQYQFNTGSIKGENSIGYFTNNINSSQLNAAYAIDLPRLMQNTNRLYFKAGIGILKSEILHFSYLNQSFNKIDYPFFSYYLGVDYNIYSKLNYGVNLKLDFYHTQTEWFDGDPDSRYDNLIMPGVSLIYVIGNNLSQIGNNAKAIELPPKDIDFYNNFDTILIPESENTAFAFNKPIPTAEMEDSVFQFIKPDNTTDSLIVKTPNARFSVICGGYNNIKNATRFCNVLNEKGIKSKIIRKGKGSSVYLISIFEANNYRTAKIELSKYYDSLVKLKIKGRLWIWDQQTTNN